MKTGIGITLACQWGIVPMAPGGNLEAAIEVGMQARARHEREAFEWRAQHVHTAPNPIDCGCANVPEEAFTPLPTGPWTCRWCGQTWPNLASVEADHGPLLRHTCPFGRTAFTCPAHP